jgi:hypothetical protein
MPRVTSGLIGVVLSEIYAAINVTTNPEIPGLPFTHGTQVEANDGSIWVFGKAGGTIAQYDTVAIDDDHADVEAITGGAAADHIHRKIGFRHEFAAMASGESGWFMLHGSPLIRVGDSAAKNVQLYTTATAGVLDDAVGTGSQFPVRGVFLASTVSTASGSVVNGALAQASFPHAAPMSVL